jgi:uncharacterized membrane protein
MARAWPPAGNLCDGVRLAACKSRDQSTAAVGRSYAARVIPWIVFAVVVVPLVVVAFVATRRRKIAGEHPASEDARAKARTEQEFAEAEAYEAKWREKDTENHQERLP